MLRQREERIKKLKYVWLELQWESGKGGAEAEYLKRKQVGAFQGFGKALTCRFRKLNKSEHDK